MPSTSSRSYTREHHRPAGSSTGRSNPAGSSTGGSSTGGSSTGGSSAGGSSGGGSYPGGSYPYGSYSVGVAVVRGRAARSTAVGEDRAGWFARLPVRLFGGAGRMVGVDAARGLAVIGLLFGWFASNGVVGGSGAVVGGAGGSVGEASSGVGGGGGGAAFVTGLGSAGVVPLIALATTALFVLVAGVSVSRALGGTAAEVPATTRLRTAVRAILLFALGGASALFGSTGIPLPAVVLQLIATLTVLALLVQRWRARTLFLVAGACLLVLPTANVLLQLWLATPEPLTPARALGTLVGSGAFPVLTWCAPFLAGVAIGRLDHERLWRLFTLGASGGALFALAIGAAGPLESVAVANGMPAVAASRLGTALIANASTADVAPAPGAGLSEVLGAVSPAVLPSPGLFDVLGASGVALSVLALCLLGGRALRWALLPLSALGSLALTLSACLLAVCLSVPDASSRLVGMTGRLLPTGTGGFRAALAFFIVIAAGSLLSIVWRIALGAGPFERLLSACTALALTPGERRPDLEPAPRSAFPAETSSEPASKPARATAPAADEDNEDHDLGGREDDLGGREFDLGGREFDRNERGQAFDWRIRTGGGSSIRTGGVSSTSDAREPDTGAGEHRPSDPVPDLHEYGPAQRPDRYDDSWDPDASEQPMRPVRPAAPPSGRQLRTDFDRTGSATPPGHVRQSYRDSWTAAIPDGAAPGDGTHRRTDGRAPQANTQGPNRPSRPGRPTRLSRQSRADRARERRTTRDERRLDRERQRAESRPPVLQEPPAKRSGRDTGRPAAAGRPARGGDQFGLGTAPDGRGTLPPRDRPGRRRSLRTRARGAADQTISEGAREPDILPLPDTLGGQPGARWSPGQSLGRLPY